MNSGDIFTHAEYKAWGLLNSAGVAALVTDNRMAGGMSWHEAGNYIIALAEEIKAQRAVVAMQGNRR